MKNLVMIGVERETLDRLKKLKEEENAKNMDEIIRKLIEKGTMKSMFGVDRGIKKLTQKEHEEMTRDAHG
ncbi:MAG: hypothetical protein HY051_05205 [Candidatus Aenigmarchaeota archaeon]|nr:hypothetical protein [Candidatus Aenigmarchaeota archaeon]